MQTYHYWSAATGACCTSFAWVTGLDDGDVDDDGKAVSSYVWLVRGGE